MTPEVRAVWNLRNRVPLNVVPVPSPNRFTLAGLVFCLINDSHIGLRCLTFLALSIIVDFSSVNKMMMCFT